MAAGDDGVNRPEPRRGPLDPALSTVKGATRLRLRVKPGASRLAILGRTRLADDQEAVALAISAPPEGGKANDAVVALLAKAWRIPKSRLAIVVGATARTKIIEITGDTALVSSTLASWLAGLPEV